MARTVVTEQEVLTFPELTPEAQQKAIEKYIESEQEDWSGEYVKDQWKEKLEALGFEDVEISYSGFSSQGDGASFTSKQFDLCSMLANLKLVSKAPGLYRKFKEYDYFAAHHCTVRRICHQYAHYNTVRVEIEEYGTEHPQQELAREALTEAVRELCKEMYKALEASYESLDNEEHAREYLDNNDDEYKPNGSRYY